MKSEKYIRAIILLLVSLVTLLSGDIQPLAPDEESFVTLDDFFITFSISGFSDVVKRIRVFFDQADITADCRITESTVSYIPDRGITNRPDIIGPHTVTIILYGSYRVEIAKRVIRFYLCKDTSISDDAKLAMIKKGKGLKGVTPVDLVNTGSIYTGINYDSYQDSGVFAGIVDAYGSGYKGKWYYNYNLSLTSQEDRRRQTLQRFRFASGYTRSLLLSIGDNWPSYNPYILDGECLRGFEINLKTPRRYANLDFAFGMTRRTVDPYIFDKKGLQALTDTAGTVTHNDSLSFFEDGTYRRRMWAARLYFGTGRVFKLGFDLLKAKDDSASLDQLYSSDTAGTRRIIGETPKDNVVAGADICFNFWQRRIAIFSTGALGFYTDNILGGAATEEEISDFAGKDISLIRQPEDIEKILIVNETTVPLPIPSDSTERVNMGSVKNAAAWDAGFKIDLPFSGVRELFECKYFFIGPNYHSLGNDYLSVNKAGVRFLEELRLFNGKIFMKGDVKIYKDDLYSVKSDPTRKVAVNCLASVVWNSRIPYFTIMVVSNDELTEASQDTTLPLRDNGFNQIGTTVQYSRDFRHTSHTFALTYTFNTYDSKLYTNDILTSFKLLGNNGFFSVVTDYNALPIQTRVGLSGFYSTGDYSVNRLAPSAGVTWYIKKDIMYADADIGFEHINDEAAEAQNYWNVKSSFTWDISRRHSLYAEAGLDRKVAAKYIDPHLQVTYEFRY